MVSMSFLCSRSQKRKLMTEGLDFSPVFVFIDLNPSLRGLTSAVPIVQLKVMKVTRRKEMRTNRYLRTTKAMMISDVKYLGYQLEGREEP
jgi:hypothetical protein